MPRYLISRVFDQLDDQEQAQLGVQARRLILEEYPEITWEHSHVVADSAGNLRSFCVYDAPNEDAIRAHGVRLGHHCIETIYEIGGDISPADFPV
jgi:Protein of unknown function (DUF4242)